MPRLTPNPRLMPSLSLCRGNCEADRTQQLLIRLFRLIDGTATAYRKAHPAGKCKFPACQEGHQSATDDDMAGAQWFARMLAANLVGNVIDPPHYKESPLLAVLRDLRELTEQEAEVPTPATR